MLHEGSSSPLPSAHKGVRNTFSPHETDKNTQELIRKQMITLREVTEKDLNSLADYLTRQPPFKQTTKELWECRFEMWWTSNPAFTSQFPRGWILENETSFVGFIGNVPVKFLVCGEERTAVAAVTWYVNPSVRGVSSIRLLNEFLNQKNAALFLFNTDAPNTMKIVHKTGFKEYILPRFQTKYLSILDKKEVGFILKEFRIIKRPTWGVIKRIGCLLREYVCQKRVIGGDTLKEEYTTSLCTSCDDSFLKIWEASRKSGDVTMSRDIKTLNWIYFSSIKCRERIVIQCRRTRDNSLAGYMVFDIIRKKPSETGIMKLMDVCVDRNDPRVTTSILQYAAGTGKKNNVSILELWADNQETEIYLKKNFTLRKTYQHHNFIKFPGDNTGHTEPPEVSPDMIAPPRGVDHF
jgi:hypothetical protein